MRQPGLHPKPDSRIRLGIEHETTLPYSPWQNGKQEKFWDQVEGRLMAMLKGVKDLTLGQLNETTQAWSELEYNRTKHSETGSTPLQRFLDRKSVLRGAPSSQTIRDAFSVQQTRRQRKSDGTITLGGVRLEIPDRFRHLERVTVRYARWDLGYVRLADPRTAETICRLYPVDLAKNADGKRRQRAGTEAIATSEQETPTPGGLPPLLKKLLRDYAATGLPPAYIPKEYES